MIRQLSMIALSAVAALGTSASAHACAGETLNIKLLSLNADGVVSRSVYVKKSVPGVDGQPTQVKYVPVVRDHIQLEAGDHVLLNSAPRSVDMSFQVDIKLEDQEKDAKGVMSSTYHVVEISTSSFGGVIQKPVKTAYRAKITSNYLGNGTYARGCGEVTKTSLDLESSSDVH